MNDSVTPPPVQGPPPLPPAPGKGSGVKLVLIIVAIVIGGLIVLSLLMTVLLLPNLNRARDLARKATCQATLNGIGKAMALYMAQNDDRLPMIKYTETVGNGANSAPTQTNQTDDDYNTGQWETALGDQAMQNVWLMLKEWLIITRGFRCPSDRANQAREVVDPHAAKYGWNSPYNYSYGLQWPYLQDAQGDRNPALFSDALDGDMVVFADLNPGGPIGPNRRPSNHLKLGTGYLLFNGSVQWQDTSHSACGLGGDEIYTNTDDVAGGRPLSKTDTSISLSGR